jgi:hypothetical protein
MRAAAVWAARVGLGFGDALFFGSQKLIILFN